MPPIFNMPLSYVVKFLSCYCINHSFKPSYNVKFRDDTINSNLRLFLFKKKSKIAVNGVVSKLHIKKTYDHVNWGFLLMISEKLSSN